MHEFCELEHIDEALQRANSLFERSVSGASLNLPQSESYMLFEQNSVIENHRHGRSGTGLLLQQIQYSQEVESAQYGGSVEW